MAKKRRKPAPKKRPLNKRDLERLFLEQLLDIAEKEDKEKPYRPEPGKLDIPVPRKIPKGTRKGKRLKTETKHPRGTNYVEIIIGEGPHNPDHILNTVDNYDYSTLDYMFRRNKPIKGAGYRPPQGIVVVITVKIGGNEWYYSKMTAFDFVVTRASMILFIKETVQEMFESWDENFTGAMENDEDEPEGILLTPGEGDTDDPRYLDPRFVYAITVKFIYGANR